MNIIQFGSLTILLLGLLIFIFPQLIGIIIGLVLIIIGINGLLFGSQLKKKFKIWRIE